MASNLIQIKRTSVAGRAANTTTLPNPGELALNMADGILYSGNGSVVFEIGANNTNARVTNQLSVNNAVANVITFANSLFQVGEGQLAWNSEDGTLDLGMGGGNVTQQIGQETYYRVKNQTGLTITEGTVVMANGTIGSSGIIKVTPAVANGAFPSQYIMGIATENILNGGDGLVTAFGKVRKIDTSMFSDGAILYADPANTGGLTQVKPQAPYSKTIVALVVKSDRNNGEIFVRPTFGSSLADDEKVELNNLANGQILVYNSANSRFENSNNLVYLHATEMLSVGNAVVNTQITAGVIRLNGSEIFVGNNTSITGNSVAVGNVQIQETAVIINGQYALVSETAGVANDAFFLGGYAANTYVRFDNLTPTFSDIFTASGSQNTFTISASIPDANAVMVTLNGMVQAPGIHYTASGTSLNLNFTPPNSTVIEVRSLGGTLIAGGSYPTSDARLKDMISPINENEAVSFVNNVETSWYSLSDDVDKRVKPGFTAQNLIRNGLESLVYSERKKGMKEEVDEYGVVSPSGTKYTVDYDSTIPLLTTALRSALKRIDKLEKELKSLKKKPK